MLQIYLTLILVATSGCSNLEDETFDSRSRVSTASADATTQTERAYSQLEKRGFTNNGAILQKITIKNGNSSLPTGTKSGWIAQGLYEDQSTRDLTKLVEWTTSESKVIKLLNSPPGTVLALSEGKAKIKVTLDQKFETSKSMTVTGTTLKKLILTIPRTSTPIGGNGLQLAATGEFSDGKTYDVTNRVSWSTNNTNRAEVSNEEQDFGLFKAYSTGSVTVTAIDEASGRQETVSVSVSNAVPWSVHIHPDNYPKQLAACKNRDSSPSPNITGKYKDSKYYVEGDSLRERVYVYMSDCSFRPANNSEYSWNEVGNIIDNSEEMVSNTGSLQADFSSDGTNLTSNRKTINVNSLRVVQIIMLQNNSDDISNSKRSNCDSVNYPSSSANFDNSIEVDDTTEIEVGIFANNCSFISSNGLNLSVVSSENNSVLTTSLNGRIAEIDAKSSGDADLRFRLSGFGSTMYSKSVTVSIEEP